MKATPRTRKLNEAVREALGAILLEEVADPRVDLATVTSVEVSADLKFADVYVVTHGDEAAQIELLEGLESAKGRIRTALGRRVVMRFLPELRFKKDPSVEQGIRITKAIREEAERRPVRESEE
ncbi:MAG: 30S ribosome-binding factor RbfA [Coriobacteriia bacterium]